MLLPKLGGFWLLPPRDFPHSQVKVTLWITTAIHLDTPKSGFDPFFERSLGSSATMTIDPCLQLGQREISVPVSSNIRLWRDFLGISGRAGFNPKSSRHRERFCFLVRLGRKPK